LFYYIGYVIEEMIKTEIEGEVAAAREKVEKAGVMIETAEMEADKSLLEEEEETEEVVIEIREIEEAPIRKRNNCIFCLPCTLVIFAYSKS